MGESIKVLKMLKPSSNRFTLIVLKVFLGTLNSSRYCGKVKSSNILYLDCLTFHKKNIMRNDFSPLVNISVLFCICWYNFCFSALIMARGLFQGCLWFRAKPEALLYATRVESVFAQWWKRILVSPWQLLLETVGNVLKICCRFIQTNAEFASKIILRSTAETRAFPYV